MQRTAHLAAKLAFPLAIGLFAIGYWQSIGEAPRAARVFPDRLIVFLLIACLAEILRELWKARRGSGEAPAVTIGPRQAGVLAAMIAFYPSVKAIGFAVPSVAFLMVVSLLCGATTRQAATVTVCGAASLLLFCKATGFQIPLF